MFSKKSKNVKRVKINAGVKTYKQVLISTDFAPNFSMRKFIIQPGGSMPLHTNEVEHEQYILNGKAEVLIGNEKINVEKDDVVYIPKGIEHNYKNIGNENFEFLCVVPNLDDQITLV